jgi:hypothetical protein
LRCRRDSRERAALTERADTAGDVASHALGAFDRRHGNVLSQRPQIERRVRGDDADREAVSKRDHECLEDSSGVDPKRASCLECERFGAGIVRVFVNGETHASSDCDTRRWCVIGGHS